MAMAGDGTAEAARTTAPLPLPAASAHALKSVPAAGMSQVAVPSPASVVGRSAFPLLPALPPPTPAETIGNAPVIPYRATAIQGTAASQQPLAQVLENPAQAAARQDSIVPLIARLAALGSRLDALPQPAAQAALQLMAMRLNLTTGSVEAKALQAAVAGSGVLAKSGADNLKSALLQLRNGLTRMPGAEIEPVQAVAGRPHPPMRGDEARTVRAEPPLPMPGEEPARGLLHHADAALSRLKLLQNASQPQESRPGAVPASQELRVEVPLLLGAQTGLLHLVVDREARRKDRPGERGWRMRFAMAFPQTGEVGAEVALVGRSVAVALWAEDAEMEAAMAADLEALRGALGVEGLEATSLRMRRRTKASAQKPGRLMDSAT